MTDHRIFTVGNVVYCSADVEQAARDTIITNQLTPFINNGVVNIKVMTAKELDVMEALCTLCI